jgi:hypothetical protein
MKKNEQVITKSTALRNDGNDIFNTLKKTDTPKILEQKLNLAISLYKESLDYEPTKDEQVKSYKNIAICYYKLYLLYPDNYMLTVNNIKDSIHYYLLCIELERNEGYIIRVTQLINELTRFLSDNHISRLFTELLWLKDHIDWEFNEVRIHLNMVIAKKYLNKAVIAFEHDDLKQTLSNAENSLEMAKEILGRAKYMETEELEDLMDSAMFYINRVKGYYAINMGRTYTTKALTDDDSLLMDFLYLALDKFREGLSYSGCLDDNYRKDVELEAICFSELGFLYLKVLKLYERAHVLLSQSVNLGLSLHKNIQTEEWYKKAVGCLQEIRLYNEKNESDEQKKQKEVYMKELKPVLEVIEKKEKDSTNAEFLKFIIEKHPPMENFKLNVDEELKNVDIKRLMVKVIGYYHPDKVLNTEGKKKVLWEEICKLLNNRYSMLKS